MQVCVWDDESIKFVEMREDDGWQHSAHLKITAETPEESLERGQQHMHDVQSVWVQSFGHRNQSAVFDLLKSADWANLSCLWFREILCAQEMREFAQALRCVPQLQQLNMVVLLEREDEGKAAKVLFDALSSVTLLSALKMGMLGYASVQAFECLCEALNNRKKTLKSLELSSFDFDDIWPVLFARLDTPQLRRLWLWNHTLSESNTESLCKLLEKMPDLEALHVKVADTTALCAFFNAAFRSIRVLQLEMVVPEGIRVASSLSLLDALKRNTRLRELSVPGVWFADVEVSGLLELGFLTELKGQWDGERPPHSLLLLLQRNKSRQLACKRACIALIAVRRSKKACVLLHVEIICMIAKTLLDTQGQNVWDGQ